MPQNPILFLKAPKLPQTLTETFEGSPIHIVNMKAPVIPGVSSALSSPPASKWFREAQGLKYDGFSAGGINDGRSRQQTLNPKPKP